MTDNVVKDRILRRRWIAVLFLLLGALLLSSPLWEGDTSSADAVFTFQPADSEAADDVFDPFGLLPENSEADPDEAIFGQMADMRVMRQALEIIGGSDLENLSQQQLDSLALLGIDRQALEKNSSLLESLIQAEEASFPKPSGWPVAAALCLLLAAAVLAVSLLRRRRKDKSPPPDSGHRPSC